MHIERSECDGLQIIIWYTVDGKNLVKLSLIKEQVNLLFLLFLSARVLPGSVLGSLLFSVDTKALGDHI